MDLERREVELALQPELQSHYGSPSVMAVSVTPHGKTILDLVDTDTITVT